MLKVRSDYDLWQAWVAGDDTAGAGLVERHFVAVYRFFGSKLPDHADDLSQSTFTACVEAKESFRAEGNFRAFVLGIARKQLLRFLEGRGQLVGGRAVSEVSMADLEPSPSTAAAQAQHRDLLLQTMRSIPLEFQIVLELHYWEDMGTQEMAEVLEVPVGTIKSRLSRARTRLRDALEHHEGDASIASLADELRSALEPAR